MTVFNKKDIMSNLVCTVNGVTTVFEYSEPSQRVKDKYIAKS